MREICKQIPGIQGHTASGLKLRPSFAPHSPRHTPALRAFLSSVCRAVLRPLGSSPHSHSYTHTSHIPLWM